MTQNRISLTQFGEYVHRVKPPVDEPLLSSHIFEVVGAGPTTDIHFAGHRAGAVPMYQVKAATGAANLNITGTTGLISTARSDRKESEQAVRILQGQVSALNSALRLSDVHNRGFKVRTIIDTDDRETVGGIVSAKYTPLTHAEFFERMVETSGFEEAQLTKWSVNPERMDFTIILGGATWAVDGGIKTGCRGVNGQFGNVAAALAAMLFRLLCTNGMMDCYDETGFRQRHTGSIDLSAEVKRVIGAAGSMYVAATAARTVEVDVIQALTELYRRGWISRGAFAKCLQRVAEVIGGVSVEGARTTLWGLSQALTAAARDYSFVQYRRMGELSGQLIRHGVQMIEHRPIIDTITDWKEVVDVNEMGE